MGDGDHSSNKSPALQIGFPVWDCVVATTPEGNTTVGQATLAILNDLGVVAEHFLVYLNNDDLTYAQDIQNDFVSLANPLYPKGPRFNFSIDFESVAKDRELFRVSFSNSQFFFALIQKDPQVKLQVGAASKFHAYLVSCLQCLVPIPWWQSSNCWLRSVLKSYISIRHTYY